MNATNPSYIGAIDAGSRAVTALITSTYDETDVWVRCIVINDADEDGAEVDVLITGLPAGVRTGFGQPQGEHGDRVNDLTWDCLRDILGDDDSLSVTITGVYAAPME